MLQGPETQECLVDASQAGRGYEQCMGSQITGQIDHEIPFGQGDQQSARSFDDHKVAV